MYYTFVLNTGGPTSTEFWYDIYDNMTTSQCIPVEADFCYSGQPFVISEIQECMSMSGGNYDCCMHDMCSFEIEESQDENGNMTTNTTARLSRQSRERTKNKGYFRHPFGTKNTRAIELAKNILSTTASPSVVGSSGITGEPRFPRQRIPNSNLSYAAPQVQSPPSVEDFFWPECNFTCSSIENSDECELPECRWNSTGATCVSFTSCDGLIDPSALTIAQNNTEISVYENVLKVVEHKCEGLLSKSSNFTFEENSIPPGWTSGDTALSMGNYGSCDGCHCYNGIHDPDCNLDEFGLPMNGQQLYSPNDGTTLAQTWTTHTCIAGKIILKSFDEDCPCNIRSTEEETDACKYAGGYSRCECEFSANSAPDMQDYVSSCQSWSYDANHCDGAVSECISHKKSCSAFYSSYTDEIFESILMMRSEEDPDDENGAWYARFARMQRAFSPFVPHNNDTCSDWENLPLNKTCKAFHCMGFGDGTRDDELNSEECGYDGGDCCMDTSSSICKDPAMKTEPVPVLSDSNFRAAVVQCLNEAMNFSAHSFPYRDGLCYNYGNASGYGPMPEWDVSRVTDMSSSLKVSTYSYSYSPSYFNGNITSWNVSSVTNMENMFGNLTVFNKDISTWDVSSVRRMGHMFQNTWYFNIDLSSWDVSQVYDMQEMFSSAKAFNQSLNSWDTQNVKNMERMFSGAISFNQPLNSWNTQSVTEMSQMFDYAVSFNQDISDWNIQKVEFMHEMFKNATSFNYDIISAWRSSLTENLETDGMFENADTFCSEKYTCGQSNQNPFSEFVSN